MHQSQGYWAQQLLWSSMGHTPVPLTEIYSGLAKAYVIYIVVRFLTYYITKAPIFFPQYNKIMLYCDNQGIHRKNNGIIINLWVIIVITWSDLTNLIVDKLYVQSHIGWLSYCLQDTTTLQPFKPLSIQLFDLVAPPFVPNHSYAVSCWVIFCPNFVDSFLPLCLCLHDGCCTLREHVTGALTPCAFDRSCAHALPALTLLQDEPTPWP